MLFGAILMSRTLLDDLGVTRDPLRARVTRGGRLVLGLQVDISLGTLIDVVRRFSLSSMP